MNENYEIMNEKLVRLNEIKSCYLEKHRSKLNFTFAKKKNVLLKQWS
jgi:hypothetical protein